MVLGPAQTLLLDDGLIVVQQLLGTSVRRVASPRTGSATFEEGCCLAPRIAILYLQYGDTHKKFFPIALLVVASVVVAFDFQASQ